MDCSEHVGGRFLPMQFFNAKGMVGRVEFVYVGRASLTVVGTATGRIYVFERPGHRLKADPRDAASMAAIRLLRKVDHEEAELRQRF